MLNVAQLKCLAVFSSFAIIGFGPISPGCLLGLYIVWKRPEWFLRLVGRVYEHPRHAEFMSAQQSRRARIKSFLTLLALFVLDILPLPITPIVAFGIILARPQWFYRAVTHVYGEMA